MRAGEHVRPTGLDVAPVLHVDLVHLGKVAHVVNEDVDLDDVLDRGARGFKHRLQVLDDAVLREWSAGLLCRYPCADFYVDAV